MFQRTDDILKLSSNDECIQSCATCESLINENIHYEGHVIRYLKEQCEIDNLSMSTVLLGDLERVDWVVLKCDYVITTDSKNPKYVYHLNNHNFKLRQYRWNKIHNTNCQMFYNINNNKHEEIFVEDLDIRNNINIIFQSDCDVTNHHRNQQYNFDIIWYKHKYYLPNLMRHYGKVDKYRVAQAGYTYTENQYKNKYPTKKTQSEKKRKKRRSSKINSLL